MDDSKYCRLCLATDVKMYSVTSSVWILETCSKLLPIPLMDQQHCICYICVHMLYKFKEFQLQCNTAHQLLSVMEVESHHSQIFKTDIRKIDRKEHKLESKLINSPVVIINNFEDDFTPKDWNGDVKGISQKKIKAERKKNTQDKISNNKKIEDVKLEITVKPETREICLDDELHSSDNGAESIETPEHIVRDSTSSRKASKEVPIKKPRERLNEEGYKNYMDIVHLSVQDAKEELLRRKEYSESRKLPFICNYCYRGYTSQATFDNHMKRQHSLDLGPIECEICHQRFKKKKIFKWHMDTSHGRKFSCKSCPYTCLSREKAKSHIYSHNGKTFPCDECGKSFTKRCSLSAHRSKKHATGCVCDLCGSMFATQNGVSTHKHIQHKTEENDMAGPKCDVCDVHFATELAFKRHLVLSPKHNVSNGCKTCGETFANDKLLKSHERTHELTESFSFTQPRACTICDVWLNTVTECIDHMTSLHPLEATKAMTKRKRPRRRRKLSVCEVCGKTFINKAHLLIHQRVHTGEKPFSCSVCGRQFRLKGNLYAHVETHKATRTYCKCPLCPKQFLRQNALDKHHKMTHLGLRPHKCSICGKGFPNPSCVKSHAKYVHFKEPWPKRNRSKRKAVRNTKDDI